jgi:hypothetical protein
MSEPNVSLKSSYKNREEKEKHERMKRWTEQKSEDNVIFALELSFELT